MIVYKTNRGLYFSLSSIKANCEADIIHWVNGKKVLKTISSLQSLLNKKPHGRKPLLVYSNGESQNIFHQIDSTMTRSMKKIPRLPVREPSIIDYTQPGIVASKYQKEYKKRPNNKNKSLSLYATGITQSTNTGSGLRQFATGSYLQTNSPIHPSALTGQNTKEQVKDIDAVVGQKTTYPQFGVAGSTADISIHDRHLWLSNINSMYLSNDRISVNILNEEYGINTIISRNGMATIANEYISLLFCQYLGFEYHYAMMKYIEEYKNNLALCKESYNHMMQARFYINTNTNNQKEAALMYELMGTTRDNMNREELYLLHCLQVMNIALLTDSLSYNERRMVLSTNKKGFLKTMNMHYDKQPYINERNIR